MSNTPRSSTAGPAPGWFANRPLAQKFGALIAVVVLAFGLLLAAVLIGNADIATANRELADLNHAQEVVLGLDTRASELKVDGYKTLVRPDPGAELDELTGDIQTGTDLLGELNTIPLTGTSAAAVGDLESTFGQYTDAITEFINTGIADQAGTRALWENIQKANDLSDGAVGAAKDALAAQSYAAQVTLDDTIARTRLITLVSAAAGLVLIVLISVVTLRSVTLPVRRVKASLEALARGDLTLDTHIRSTDEIGAMAAFDAAQANLREVMGVVAGSAGAVATSAEELSASATQISSSAEETSAQSGVVSSAAEEVSRSVETVAAGAEQMGASIREIATN